MMVATSSGPQRSNAGGHASEKRSLASILRDHGPVPVTDAVDIALDICDELANAHANGVVHGDLGMHRVRTHWPRIPGQRVDIFALGENDSAAFAFRASAVAGLVAPEQRENRSVDTRADVWAVGAMLHWMIAGAAPSGDPAARTLAKAPRTLAATIEACLEVDPAKRPQSVDELAQVIASFASSPPERFEQLARRRTLLDKAKRIRSDLGDVESVLGRLDDAALQRELAAASTPSPPDAIALDRLMFAVNRTTGSAIFEKSAAVILDLAEDDQEDVETVLAQPRYAPDAGAEQAVAPVPSPLSLAPVVLSSELLSPPKEAPPAARPPESVLPATEPPSSRPLRIVLGIVGATLALALGVGIGMRLVERALARQAAAVAQSAAGPPAVAAGLPPAPRAAAQAPTPPAGSTAATSSTMPVAPAPAVVSPAALPDALPLSVSSLPDARLVTPASLPDAKPSAVARVTPPKPAPPAAGASGDASPTEVSPTSLSDALR